MTRGAIAASAIAKDAAFLSCENEQGIYMLTQSGVQFCLSDPSAKLVRIEDIAHALSCIPRFNGQTKNPRHVLSVAQHSIEVMLRIPAFFPAGEQIHGVQFAALLHDAHEAYTGDISTPVAKVLGAVKVSWLKARIQAAIHGAFGFPWPLPVAFTSAIKQADLDALFTERQDYMEHDNLPWSREQAHERFLNHFTSLKARLL